MRAIVSPREVRPARREDLPAIAAIQNALLDSTAVEWTDEPHTVAERTAWLAAQEATGNPALVAIDRGEVVGWASYGDFRDSTKRPGYRFTVEHSVHVRDTHWGTGTGRRLMEALIAHARAAGKHVMVAAIDGENAGSIRFHERLGFERVGHLREVGFKFGRRLDLVFLQKILDSE